MDLDHGDFPQWLVAASWASCLAGAMLLFARGGARELYALLQRHLYLAVVVSLLLLWQLRAVTPLGPGLHVLGATVLTLMFGWRGAAGGMALVLAGHTANGASDWPAFALNLLATGWVPVAVSHGVLALVTHRLRSQPFGYILLCAFAGAAFAMAASLTACSLLLLGMAQLDATQLIDQFTITSVLLVFPEAFLTGTTVAWLAMFYPSTLCTWHPPWRCTPDP